MCYYKRQVFGGIMSVVLTGFTNEWNQSYDNIKNVHFDNMRQFRRDMNGEYHKLSDLSSEVDIYQMKGDPTKALRINKKFIDFKTMYCNEEYLISELQARQKDVLLTEFPTGIVTFKDQVIGQKIPFYGEAITLRQAIMKRKFLSYDELLDKMIDILRILRELLNVGIIYQDIHMSNFMVNEKNGKINLIDFDKRFVKFYDYMYARFSMVDNLKQTLQAMSIDYGVKFKNDFNTLYTFEEIFGYVTEEKYKILEKKLVTNK